MSCVALPFWSVTSSSSIGAGFGELPPRPMLQSTSSLVSDSFGLLPSGLVDESIITPGALSRGVTVVSTPSWFNADSRLSVGAAPPPPRPLPPPPPPQAANRRTGRPSARRPAGRDTDAVRRELLDLRHHGLPVGVQLWHQFVQGQLDAQGALLTLSGNNALRLTIGAL